MTTPREIVEADLKKAMKAREKERVSTLRLLLSEIRNEEIRRHGDVDRDAFWALVRKALKQRGESAEQYREGDRPELAEKEEAEAEILADYLPQQASEEELRAAVGEIVAEQGLSGPSGIGPVMQSMMARFSGRADGALINRIAREILSE